MSGSDQASAVRHYYGPVVLAEEVGLARWQVERADAAGLLPPAEHARGWLPHQVEKVRELVPTIVERVGAEHPVGARRCAERLGARLEMAVATSDVEALAEAGHLQVVETFKGSALFAPAVVDALDADMVATVVAARHEWTAASVSLDEACEHLGWRRDELHQALTDRSISTGRFDRLRREDVDVLAADAELCAQIRGDRLLTADQVAERMDVDRRHVDIAVGDRWITPKRHYDKQVGRYKTVSVPLYRTGDVDDLLERPDVSWCEVRETPKGERSPLLRLVGGRQPSRAQVIRAFLRNFGAEHGIEM